MAKTFKDLMEEARREVPEWSIDQVKEHLGNGNGYALVDVREKEEYREGHLDGAISLPRGFLEMRVEEAVPDKSRPIIAYCAGGTRSLLAAKQLKEMGYQNVISMSGGYSAWKGAGYPWKQDRQFTPEQLNRYSRHFLLPEVGEEGQAKLLDAKVLLIGAGGLGSPTALLPGGRRRRHDRHRRPRRRRPEQPAAPDPAHQRARRHAEGRVGARDAAGAQPRRQGHRLPGAPVVRERHAPLRRLRRHRRRLRQLPDPLPGERRLRDARQAERARQHLPVRRPGDGVLSGQGALLPLPVPRAAAAGRGAELRGGRRARACCRDSSAACRRSRPSS